jgi:hypothetical protein
MAIQKTAPSRLTSLFLSPSDWIFSEIESPVNGVSRSAVRSTIDRAFYFRTLSQSGRKGRRGFGLDLCP